jgi:TonB family protein
VVTGLAAALLTGVTAGYFGVRERAMPASGTGAEAASIARSLQAPGAAGRAKERGAKPGAEDATDARDGPRPQRPPHVQDELGSVHERVAEQARNARVASSTPSAAVQRPPAAPRDTGQLGKPRPGTLVGLTAPGVIAPQLERVLPLASPAIALRQGVEGSVGLNILIDERGNVADARIVGGVSGRRSLGEAALASVKRRRYRPATKDGVPVKVWLPVRVEFRQGSRRR